MSYIDENDSKRALAVVSKDPKMQIALKSAAPCGMTTVELIKFELAQQGVNVKERNLYNTLSRMTLAKDFPPLLKQSTEFIAGQRGRKRNAYRLTKFGEKILKMIDPKASIRFTSGESSIGSRHRYCQLEIYTLARKQGWEAEVEKVIPFQYVPGGDRSVRPDLVLRTPQGPLYIEIEQEISVKNAARAAEKLNNWQDYSIATGDSPHVILCFNIEEKRKKKKAPGTVQLWQNALYQVERARGGLSFEISYLYMSALRGQDGLESDLKMAAGTLLPEKYGEKPQEALAANRWTPPSYLQNAMDALDDEVSEWENTRWCILRHYGRGETLSIAPYQHVLSLLRIAKIIYDASHSLRPADLYLPLTPIHSIHLLRYYLTHPGNAQLYERLKKTINLFGRTSGVTQQKILVSDLANHVLENFFISEGDGAFRLSSLSPDYMREDSSRFRVDVKIDARIGIPVEQIDTYAMALQWMLEALIVYKDYLGLAGEDRLDLLEKEIRTLNAED